MIIQNGTIEFKRKSSGRIDPETGYPSKAKDLGWSDPIPCQFMPVSRQLLVKTQEGERITKATYTVLIEMQPLPSSEQIRLTDQNGKCVGEFSMIAPPEILEAVCEVKILI